MKETPHRFVDQLLENTDTDPAALQISAAPGPISHIARHYTSDKKRKAPYLPDNLLGFLLSLSYEDVTIITCDPWKRNCGGVPRNSLVLVKLSPQKVSAEEYIFCDRVIMVRITESVPTPVASEIQQTIFQIHKAQANVDMITNKELQWSALKGKIIGTFYDGEREESKVIGFGLDVDTFFAPHFYEVFVPTSDHLQLLINAFSDNPEPLEIGFLRYTETPSIASDRKIQIFVDPSDFTGKSYGHRTALFGKTRFGKSNTMKVIADTNLQSSVSIGQIIFDPSGEYTYWNEQDRGCLFVRHPGKCIRYSLNPQEPQIEKSNGLQKPDILRVNFFKQPDVGHGIISELWPTEIGRIPDYMTSAINWEPDALDKCPDKNNDASGFNHFWRTMAIWYAILIEAGFEPGSNQLVPISFPKYTKQALAADENLKAHLKLKETKSGDITTDAHQPIKMLPAIYKKVYALWKEHRDKKDWFDKSSEGSSYFSTIEEGMLKILEGQIGTGAKKFNRFLKYHAAAGTDIFGAIVEHALKGKTVFIDLSMGDENVRKSLARQICQALLRQMMLLFSQNSLSNRFVVLYFEEAHILFPKDDRALGEDVYNKIAKEGAKFHISMVYATQSMSTLSPDLLKNTENIIVTHLDDDREVRELEHKRAFRDIAADVERITSKGYVRMKTLSLPFALPVQIRKFDGSIKKEGNLDLKKEN